MEEPILFRCSDCKCYTILYDQHGSRIYFKPNFCGHCGAQNR